MQAGAGGRQRKSKKKCEKAKREKNNIIGKLDRVIMAIERERERCAGDTTGETGCVCE